MQQRQTNKNRSMPGVGSSSAVVHQEASCHVPGTIFGCEVCGLPRDIEAIKAARERQIAKGTSEEEEPSVTDNRPPVPINTGYVFVVGENIPSVRNGRAELEGE